MARALSFACLILFALCAEAAACTGRFSMRENATVTVRTAVWSGGECRIRLLHSRGPIYSSEIVQRPSNGALSISASHLLVYKPRQGFAGNDTFGYALKGETHAGVPVVFRVRMLMRVVQRRS